MAPLSSKELGRIEPYEILIKRNKKNGLDKDGKILFNRLRAVEKETRLGNYIWSSRQRNYERNQGKVEIGARFGGLVFFPNNNN